MFSLSSTNIQGTYLSVHVFLKLYKYPMYIPFGPCRASFNVVIPIKKVTLNKIV